MVGVRVASLIAVLLFLTACASSPNELAQADPTPVPQASPTTPPTSLPTTAPTEAVRAPTATNTPSPTSAPDPTAVPTEEPVPLPDDATAAANCVRLTDFSIDAQNLAWFMVNDGVMGGRSQGAQRFSESSMIFEGEINTNGGGFSSVRVSLGENALAGFSELVVRARTDGRSYRVVLEDNLEGRDRRVSQQGALVFDQAADWQLATVDFADLQPSIFGRSVVTDPFRADLATQLGISLADGVDGPFMIEIDWIDACG